MRTLQNTVFNTKRLIDKVSATAKAVSPKLLDLSKEAATSIKDGWNGEHAPKPEKEETK